MIITYAISVVICLLIVLLGIHMEGYINWVDTLFSFVPIYNTLVAIVVLLGLILLILGTIAMFIQYGIYLLITFVLWEIDPSKWPKEFRAGFSIMDFMLIVFWLAYNDNKSNHSIDDGIKVK